MVVLFEGMVGIEYSFVCVIDVSCFVLVGVGLVGIVDEVMVVFEVLCDV